MLPCRMCVSQRVAEPFVVHRIRSAAPPLPEAEVGGWTVWLLVIISFFEAALISATVLREKEKRMRWREKFNLKTNPDFLIINTCIKPHTPEPWDVSRKAKQDKETSQQWFWIGDVAQMLQHSLRYRTSSWVGGVRARLTTQGHSFYRKKGRLFTTQS